MNKRVVSLAFVSALLLSVAMETPFIVQVAAEPASSLSLAKIDVFTSKGGKGPNVPSDPFRLREIGIITVYAYLEYNGTPVPNNYITFFVYDLKDNLFMLKENLTDASGLAFILFRLPTPTPPDYLLGNWSVTAPWLLLAERRLVTLSHLRSL